MAYYDIAAAKKWVQDILRDNVVDVEFIKADGSFRKMKCTLIDDYIKDDFSLHNAKNESFLKKYIDPHVIVWDLQEHAWRKFNMDTVRKFVIHVGN